MSAMFRLVFRGSQVSDGISNTQLGYGKPEEVRASVRKVIDEVACDGGYILDASAIMQNDTSIENLRALTEAAREYGVYSSAASAPPIKAPPSNPCDGSDVSGLKGLDGWPPSAVPPGICSTWETKVQELSEISGDKELLRRIWQNIDALGNTYIWQCLLSF